jgi:hypothetical protein
MDFNKLLNKLQNNLPNILSWVIIYFIYFFVCNSAISKLFNNPEMIEELTTYGLIKYKYFIAVFEIIAVSLLLSQRFMLFGVVLLTGLMSGAIAINLSHNNGIGVFLPLIIAMFAWGWYFLQKNNK